jgi:type 1 glutamine amidotransferase
MARNFVLVTAAACILASGCQSAQQKDVSSENGWIRIFDGETLNGWRASENQGTFTTKDGMIVVHGARSHLFYDGPVADANFTNFEFKADVMTKPGANSGMYIHTKYQPDDWPKQGYEIQVNSTHSDWKKTGSIYDVENVRQSPSKNDEWFTQHIIVCGKRITVKVNGKTVVDWTEPENFSSPGWPGRKLSRGTVALQGHDPKSIVYYKNIMVKILPPGSAKKIRAVVLTGGHDFEHDPFFELFKGYSDIDYVEAVQKDHSEIFEDISDWDYDVIVLYNMTQNISTRRKSNFLKLLDRGVGVVALHHNMGSFGDWPEYRKIIGTKYYLKPTEEAGVKREGSTYKHDVDMNVRIADTGHPITRNMSDFTIHDEAYKKCGFEKDNHVLLTTDHPDSDETIGWVRKYSKAGVCTIQLGHDSKAYANENYRKLIARAVRWATGRLE